MRTLSIAVLLLVASTALGQLKPADKKRLAELKKSLSEQEVAFVEAVAAGKKPVLAELKTVPVGYFGYIGGACYIETIIDDETMAVRGIGGAKGFSGSVALPSGGVAGVQKTAEYVPDYDTLYIVKGIATKPHVTGRWMALYEQPAFVRKTDDYKGEKLPKSALVVHFAKNPTFDEAVKLATPARRNLPRRKSGSKEAGVSWEK